MGQTWRSSFFAELHVCIFKLLPTSGMRHKVQFYAKFNRFEFRVYIHLDWLPYQCNFAHRWRENVFFYNFPKGISATLNANSIVNDLNSGRCSYFLSRYPWHQECLYKLHELQCRCWLSTTIDITKNGIVVPTWNDQPACFCCTLRKCLMEKHEFNRSFAATRN